MLRRTGPQVDGRRATTADRAEYEGRLGDRRHGTGLRAGRPPHRRPWQNRQRRVRPGPPALGGEDEGKGLAGPARPIHQGRSAGAGGRGRPGAYRTIRHHERRRHARHPGRHRLHSRKRLGRGGLAFLRGDAQHHAGHRIDHAGGRRREPRHRGGARLPFESVGVRGIPAAARQLVGQGVRRRPREDVHGMGRQRRRLHVRRRIRHHPPTRLRHQRGGQRIRGRGVRHSHAFLR